MVSPASQPQRAKTRDANCASCGRPGSDPAHLVPRSLGGCDHPDCVIALCRDCHRAFDDGMLDLEALLALPTFSLERSHMAAHMSFARCVQRLRGSRV